MFGPQSGKESWKNLPFVYEKVRVGKGNRRERCDRFLDIFADEVDIGFSAQARLNEWIFSCHKVPFILAIVVFCFSFCMHIQQHMCSIICLCNNVKCFFCNILHVSYFVQLCILFSYTSTVIISSYNTHCALTVCVLF